VLGKIVHVGDAHTAGIDELEEPIVVAHEVREAIARDTRLVIDNGDADAGEPIQHAALANVWPANDYYLRNAHRNSD